MSRELLHSAPQTATATRQLLTPSSCSLFPPPSLCLWRGRAAAAIRSRAALLRDIIADAGSGKGVGSRAKKNCSSHKFGLRRSLCATFKGRNGGHESRIFPKQDRMIYPYQQGYCHVVVPRLARAPSCTSRKCRRMPGHDSVGVLSVAVEGPILQCAKYDTNLLMCSFE